MTNPSNPDKGQSFIMVLEAVSRVEQDVVVRCINTEPGVGEHKYNNLLMRGQGAALEVNAIVQ